MNKKRLEEIVESIMEEMLERSLSKYRKEWFIELRKDLVKIILEEHLQDLSTLKEDKDNVGEIKTTLTDRINQAQNNAEIWTAIWELHDEIIRQNIG